jgi:Putative Actinobacterial Holin-X, holin superfamily III
MEHSANSAHAPAEREQTTGELVKQLSEQVSLLVRDELKMARLELSRKGKQAGLGMGMFGVSGLGALYGVACLLAAAIIAISGEVRPWLAALIVGLALLAASGVAALAGRGRMRRATPPVPEQAVESTKADVGEVRERMHR